MNKCGMLRDIYDAVRRLGPPNQLHADAVDLRQVSLLKAICLRLIIN